MKKQQINWRWMLRILILSAVLSGCSQTSITQQPTSSPTQFVVASETLGSTPVPTSTFSTPTSITKPELNLTPAVQACLSPAYPATIHYANEDQFGDGYISRIAIKDMEGKNNGEIVLALVNQWLEHYKTRSKSASASIKGYDIEEVNLLDTSCDPFFEIVAGVNFSIIPAQAPNDYASFPSATSASSGGDWWDIGAPFGVFKDGDFYRLRLVFGWGT
jgi:hypothetical protein